MTDDNEKRIAVVEFEGEFLRTQEDFKFPNGVPVQRLQNIFGMTRDEAVERINHALCVKIYGPCNQCTQVHGHCNDYKSYAETALDALKEF